ncbi:MAG: hypothetical protein J5I98_05975 [Phaeodactylibacter sp.]|nr:hypothetical protein [Phaeodactylibacter sp.]
MDTTRLEAIFENPGDAPCPGESCCGNRLVVREELLELLEELTRRMGKKLYLKYLYKCADFNRSIRGRNNFHAIGLAVDIDTVRSGIETAELAQIAWDIGFNAVGVYGTNLEHGYNGKKGMVHLGLEGARRYWGDWVPASQR